MATIRNIFGRAYLGYIGQAIIGVKVPNSSHVACIQHGRVHKSKNPCRSVPETFNIHITNP